MWRMDPPDERVVLNWTEEHLSTSCPRASSHERIRSISLANSLAFRPADVQRAARSCVNPMSFPFSTVQPDVDRGVCRLRRAANAKVALPVSRTLVRLRKMETALSGTLGAMKFLRGSQILLGNYHSHQRSERVLWGWGIVSRSVRVSCGPMRRLSIDWPADGSTTSSVRLVFSTAVILSRVVTVTGPDPLCRRFPANARCNGPDCRLRLA